MAEETELEKTMHNTKLSYETLWKSIIRPPRDIYSFEDLGPKNFIVKNIECVRDDYTLMSATGHLIPLSHFRIISQFSTNVNSKESFISSISTEDSTTSNLSSPHPLVIYLHGNSSSRLEGKRLLRSLISHGIELAVFDFAGSGLSEGEYISLGYHEQRDVKTVVDFMEKRPGIGKIGLWGRSMGAATTMLYAHQDKRIKAICMDSPFANFRELSRELCYKEIGVPGFVVDSAMFFVKKTCKSKNKMEIDKLKPIDCAENTTCPAIFIHAMKDELIPHTHTVKLFEKYGGKKSLNIVEGHHNTTRQKHIIDKVIKFFEENLSDDYDIDIHKNSNKINNQEKNKSKNIDNNIDNNINNNENNEKLKE